MILGTSASSVSRWSRSSIKCDPSGRPSGRQKTSRANGLGISAAHEVDRDLQVSLVRAPRLGGDSYRDVPPVREAVIYKMCRPVI